MGTIAGITRHGDRRGRERLGIPRKAVRRMAERAWNEGEERRDWPRRPPGGFVKQLGQWVFIFTSVGSLVTVVPADRQQWRD